MSIPYLLIQLISFLSRALFLLILAKVILSYFMDPFHPVRRFIDRIIDPLLAPIRRVVPPIQMIDFSPLILLILVQIVEYILVRILAAMI